MRKKKRTKQSKLGRHKVVIALGAAVLVLYGAAGYKAFRTEAHRNTQSAPASNPIPTYYQHAKDAMPFPATLDPAGFKRADIREAYQVAKDIPDVLAQQPCYCYCQRQGHRGLLDCFRTEHAASCDICIKEALLAGRMHHEGKSVEETRAAIIHGDWTNVVASREPNTQKPIHNDKGESRLND